MVINRDDVQGYAAKVCFEALQLPAAHENMIKIGGYILGEFGNLIAGDPRSSPAIQLNLLHSRFHLCSQTTRGLLLTTYIKFVNLFPEIKDDILKILETDAIAKSNDIELQQRALEYRQLAKVTSKDVLATVLEEMPPFKTKEESNILSKLRKTKPASAKMIERSRSGTPNSSLNSGQTGSPSKKPQIASITTNVQAPPEPKPKSNTDMLVDLLGGEMPNPVQTQEPPVQPTVHDQNVDLIGGDLMGGDLMGGNLMGGDIGGNLPQSQPAADIFNASNGQTVPQNAQQSVPQNPLSNIFDAPLSDPIQQIAPAANSPPAAHEYEIVALDLNKFSLRDSGVLFENDSCQIGIRADFNTPELTIALFFGNKTSLTFEDFYATLEDSKNLFENFNFESTPPSRVDAGAQLQLKIATKYTSPQTNDEQVPTQESLPVLTFSYSANSEKTACKVKMPTFVNKFMQGAQMNSQQFFQRWQLLNKPGQESQVIQAMSVDFNDIELVSSKLSQARFDVLKGIDPNASNYVCAGIVRSSVSQIGVLCRLEPNMQTNQYRLTVRSTNSEVSSMMTQLLALQF